MEIQLTLTLTLPLQGCAEMTVALREMGYTGESFQSLIQQYLRDQTSALRARSFATFHELVPAYAGGAKHEGAASL